MASLVKGKPCAACGNTLCRGAYSANNWAKGATKRRCKKCINEKRPVFGPVETNGLEGEETAKDREVLDAAFGAPGHQQQPPQSPQPPQPLQPSQQQQEEEVEEQQELEEQLAAAMEASRLQAEEEEERRRQMYRGAQAEDVSAACSTSAAEAADEREFAAVMEASRLQAEAEERQRRADDEAEAAATRHAEAESRRQEERFRGGGSGGRGAGGSGQRDADDDKWLEKSRADESRRNRNDISGDHVDVELARCAALRRLLAELQLIYRERSEQARGVSLEDWVQDEFAFSKAGGGGQQQRQQQRQPQPQPQQRRRRPSRRRSRLGCDGRPFGRS